MKNILIVLLIALCAITTYKIANSRMNVMIVGGGGATPATTTAPAYTEEFYWDGELANCTEAGSPYTACTGTENGNLFAQTNNRSTSAGDYILGTLTDATMDGSIKHNGNYSLLVNANNERLSFPITAKNIFDSTQGYLKAWVYFEDAPSATMTFMEATTDTQNYWQANARTTPVIRPTIESNDVVLTGGDGAITLDTWIDLRIKWNTAGAAPGGQVAVSIDGGANWVWDNDSDNIAAFASEPAAFLIGEFGGAAPNVNVYIDEVSVWTTADGT